MRNVLIIFLIGVVFEQSTVLGAYQKEEKAVVPTEAIKIDSETQKKILEQLEQAKVDEKQVLATFKCNFTDFKKTKAVKVCKLIVVRPEPK